MSKMYIRISATGLLSVYGLGPFPITMSQDQWIKLIEASEDIKDFLEKNKDSLGSEVSKPRG